MDKNENCILVSKKGERKGDMAKLVDATDLHWIEPWYGNLLSDNFQIQRNPGKKKWAILSQILFFANKQRFRKVKKRIGAETQWKLF